MIGFAINIIAFIIIATFLFYLGMGALSLIVTLFSSQGSRDNRARGLLGPVLKILGISEGETIRPETTEVDLKEAIKVYYEILRKVFESETPEQRKEVLTSDTPSGKTSNAFYAITGLSKTIDILARDIDHVMDGSGWVEYKKLLKDATGGTLKKDGDKDKYEIIFNKEFYMTIEKYNGYGNPYGDEKEWHIKGYYNKKEVLSCYTPRTNDIAYTFKPDVWILDIIQSAKKYSRLVSEYELKRATNKRKSELFD